ncbi:MAG TPA: hypothetical protein VE732_00680 [Nitrososphaera sp.]|jgi:hypothetical protein|nr:hypothetical protein [Nitrososphaera sp.]
MTVIVNPAYPQADLGGHMSNSDSFFVIKRIAFVLVLGLGFAAINVKAQTEEKPLTNEDIIHMVKGKVAESIILTKIRTTNNSFDTSPDGLLQLTNAKVKKNIMDAMMVASQTRRFPSSPSLNTSTLSSSSMIEKSIRDIIHDKTIQTRTSQSLTFDLKRCNTNESVIVCYFTISSQGGDRTLTLKATGISLVDNEGNEKTASDIRIGGDQGEDVTHLIPQGYPVLSWVRFERSSSGVLKIARLNLKLGLLRSEDVTFRDIPLQQGVIPIPRRRRPADLIRVPRVSP